jgi:hypothetical protein
MFTRAILYYHTWQGFGLINQHKKALSFYVPIDRTKCPVMFDWIDAQAADGMECQSLNQEYYSFFWNEDKINIRIKQSKCYHVQ